MSTIPPRKGWHGTHSQAMAGGVIPVSAAERIAKGYGLERVLIVGVELDSGSICSAVYGRNQSLTKIAAHELERVLAAFKSLPAIR